MEGDYRGPAHVPQQASAPLYISTASVGLVAHVAYCQSLDFCCITLLTAHHCCGCIHSILATIKGFC
jgi:hypothetical protein